MHFHERANNVGGVSLFKQAFLREVERVNLHVFLIGHGSEVVVVSRTHSVSHFVQIRDDLVV